ncbi:MAG: hypothetical protein HOW73_41755 [Polyangiaceae bacterium]|nr:hypothetical protein [Polyangiaceae bacterium]
MRLRSFSFMGIRGLDGLRQDLPKSNNTDLVVVRGGYTRGKTTFLDTIAASKENIGAYGTPDGRWDSLVGSPTGAAKVRLDWEVSDNEQVRAALPEAFLSSESILGKSLAPPEPPRVLKALLTQPPAPDAGSIHYFHDTRDLSGPVSFGAAETAFAERLSTRNSKFADLYDLLDQPEKRAARELGAARYSELFPHLEIVGLRRTGVSFVPVIRNRDTNTERSYAQLSSSERHAFIMALYTAKAPIVDSIVMVDAPEIGFGDEGAIDLVRALCRWTNRTQIIVATASRAVAAMPEVGNLVVLP